MHVCLDRQCHMVILLSLVKTILTIDESIVGVLVPH